MDKRIFNWIILGCILVGTWFIVLFFMNGFNFEPKMPMNEVEPHSLEVPPKEVILGVYEVCSDVEECDAENIEEGIKKIKEVGASSIIITVTDEDGLESVSYYDSQYLTMADYVSEDYLSEVIRIAHENDVKVYASINIPHNYWLKDHPDWITIWSNGKAGDYYEQDYFHRTVPPSRMVSEQECKDLLKNIVEEVMAYGVDGIDINDNFQFSDQYLEETDTVLFSSFDEFTINKFEEDGSGDWAKWRAGQVTELITYLNEIITIPLRPHLLTHGDPYQYYGLDYPAIAQQVDVMYLMIMPNQAKEKHLELIEKTKKAGAKRTAVSTYPPYRVEWIKEAGADEIYLYNFNLLFPQEAVE